MALLIKMTLTTFYITLILLASIITVLGIQVIKIYFKVYEHLLYPKKVSFKKEAKERYQRKYATKRISKPIRKV